ncbi:hypothetical protein Tco_0713914 [Tanacetum coccineum]
MNRPAFYKMMTGVYFTITPVLQTEEPDNSLSMGDGHLSTIPEMKADGLIKSSVENLVPIPSESEDFSDIEKVLTKSGGYNDVDISTRELYVHVPNVLSTFPTFSLMFDTLLPFSSENDDKVFNHGILASNEEKSPYLLSHRGFNPSKIISDFQKARSEDLCMGYSYLGYDPFHSLFLSSFYQLKYGGSSQSSRDSDCPDYYSSRARVLSFVHSRASNLRLIMGIQYPTVID